MRELLPAVIGHWSALDWLTASTWGAIAVFVTLDLAVLAHRDPSGAERRSAEAATAVRMVLGALVVGALYGVVFARLWAVTAGLAPGGLERFWQEHPWLAAPIAFVAWDLSGWIYHLVGHRTRLGWAAHRAHHTGTEWNGSLALRLTWMPWHGLAHHPLLAVCGFDLRVVLGCLAVSNLCQALQHGATLPPVPRWLGAVVITPGAHRHHHGDVGHRANLGPVLTIWDRLAGTWQPAGAMESGPAIAAVDSPTGAVRTELHGWAELVGGTRSRRSDAAAPVG